MVKGEMLMTKNMMVFFMILIGFVILFLKRKEIIQTVAKPPETKPDIKTQALSELVGIGIGAISKMVDYGLDYFTRQKQPISVTHDTYIPTETYIPAASGVSDFFQTFGYEGAFYSDLGHW
jgi:hypothetical protein